MTIETKRTTPALGGRGGWAAGRLGGWVGVARLIKNAKESARQI